MTTEDDPARVGAHPARVAITGSSGFIGRHVAAAFRSLGTEVVPLDLRDEARVVDVRLHIEPDLFAGCDAVVHLAALSGVAPSLERPVAYEHTNVDGTARVADAAVAAAVPRLVVASSSSVYGECAGPAGEDTPLRPLSPYGRTKLAAEQAAAARAADIEVVVVRPFTVYGPGQRADMLLARMLAGERCTLWPFARDFTYIDDVVAGVVAAVTAPLTGRRACWNLGSGRPVTAAALIDSLEQATGRRPDVEWGPPRPHEAHRTWADPTRATRDLGLPAPLPLVEGLRHQADAARG
ncbi:MAG TPA: NAD-dependent epimerase/dehydratase family protein [Acidimicrobiales bacterium]|nr:NAD-dependent epimerase/dehydratase family protein [Acidimicrobiales bacterium]